MPAFSFLQEHSASLLALAGACALLLGAARLVQWLSRRRQRAEARRQVLRLARDIVQLAQGVAADLEVLAAHGRPRVQQSRCGYLRGRADAALRHADWLHDLSLRRLRRALSRLHSDRRKLVWMRQQVKAELGALRGSRSRVAQADGSKAAGLRLVVG